MDFELIPVSKTFAIVSSEDVAQVENHKWILSNGYAITRIDGRTISMHRLLMGDPPKLEIDHINGGKLDNTRQNLRVCTRAENSRNCRARAHNKSGFKGVYLDCKYRSRGGGLRWRAQITVDGVRHRLGRYATPREAHKAYRDKAIELHGEFARSA